MRRKLVMAPDELERHLDLAPLLAPADGAPLELVDEAEAAAVVVGRCRAVELARRG
jgi:hypothetical protein